MVTLGDWLLHRPLRYPWLQKIEDVVLHSFGLPARDGTLPPTFMEREEERRKGTIWEDYHNAFKTGDVTVKAEGELRVGDVIGGCLVCGEVWNPNESHDCKGTAQQRAEFNKRFYTGVMYDDDAVPMSGARIDPLPLGYAGYCTLCGASFQLNEQHVCPLKFTPK